MPDRNVCTCDAESIGPTAEHWISCAKFEPRLTVEELRFLRENVIRERTAAG